MIESRQRIADCQGRDALWVAAIEIQRDHASHREAYEVCALDAKMIEHTRQVHSEIAEIQRSRVILARTITAGVPRDGVEPPGEERQLIMPVGPVAADAVQEHDKRACTSMIDGYTRLARDKFSAPLCHLGLFSWRVASYCMITPPSGWRIEPVKKLPSSLARNSAVLATSSGLPIRLSGVRLIIRSKRGSRCISLVIGVSMTPGPIALAVML